MMRYIVVGALAICSAAAGAYPGVSTTTQKGPLSHLGFLDASRLSIQNTMFFGYANDGSRQQGGGALMTTLGYAVNPRLTVRATLSKEFTFLGQGSSDEGISLSGLELEWNPSTSLYVRFAFSSPTSVVRDPRRMTWR